MCHKEHQMTADEYLTILAEIDPELADELRTYHMCHVEFAVSRYRETPTMVMVCVLGRVVDNLKESHPLLEDRYNRIDREMDARLKWFK